MESSSVKETQRKIKSETNECENVVKLEPEIKTEEDIKIKLEPNGKELDAELENGLKEMENMDFTAASCSSNPRNIRKSESSSVKEIERKIESETTERENVVKSPPEIKTEEDIKIKLEPNYEEDSQNENHELIWLDSNLVVVQEFEEKEKIGIAKTESSAKGQLISECLFAVLNFSKMQQDISSLKWVKLKSKGTLSS